MNPTVVVINLRRRPDRLAAFDARWRAADTGLRYWLHEAVDGPDGTAGCLASHKEVLARFRDGPLLVLEDDACFAPGFTPYPKDIPFGWQIAWLGGQHRMSPIPVSDGWTCPRFLVRTHAYLVRNPPIVAKLLQLANPTRLDPVLASLPVPQYAQQPFTVGQSADRSDIDGKIRKHDEYWNDVTPFLRPVTETSTTLPGER